MLTQPTPLIAFYFNKEALYHPTAIHISCTNLSTQTIKKKEDRGMQLSLSLPPWVSWPPRRRA